MVERQLKDSQFIIDMIDNEGWPDALQWLVGVKFEDSELDQMIYDAYIDYASLERWRDRILAQAEDLGADNYLG